MKKPIYFLAAALLAAEARAQDWTQFRGPNTTGISKAKGLPVKWSPADYRWRVKLPGDGDGQPVFWGDKIFVLGQQSQGQERHLVCLQREDGKELWVKKYPLNTYKLGRSRTWSLSTPAVDKDRVYACLVDPQQFLVKAWDHAGKELWSVNLGPFKSQHGHGASPIVYEDKLIVPNDQDGPSFVIALDVKTGKAVWKCPRRPEEQGTAYATPYVHMTNGGKPELLLTSQAHGISSIDPKTGALNWEAKVFDKRAVSCAVVCGSLVFGTCGSGGGGMYLAAVKLGGRGDVTTSHQVYTLKDKDTAPYVPTPIALGDRLFMISDSGFASCVEASTGKIVWRERVGGGYFASPILADGKLYCSSKEGEVAVWEAADQFKLLAKNPIGEGSHTSPCVDGDRLYFKTFNHLVCVGGK
jgi:outer membrane protein assembly factor BamB